MTKRSNTRKKFSSVQNNNAGSAGDDFANVDRARLAFLLEQHVLGRRQMDATQLRAIEILLRKTVPDVARRPVGDPKAVLEQYSIPDLEAVLERKEAELYRELNLNSG